MAEKEYYLIINDSQQGPFSLEELGRYGVERDTRVFRLGASGFVNAEEIKEIKEFYFSGRRPAPKPVVTAEETTIADSQSINRQAVSEAARRERERRRKLEEARKITEQPPFPGSVTPPIADYPAPPVAPPFIQPSEPKEWYIINDGIQQGPVTLTELKSCTLTEQTRIWRSGMSDWQSASYVPEIAPFVAPAPAPIPSPIPVTPVAPPPISVTDVVGDPSFADTSAEDARAFGNPKVVPIASLILTLICIGGLCYFFYINFLWMVTPFLIEVPALLLSFVALANASSAKKLYFNDKVKKACKKSGAATAYGWAAIIFSILYVFNIFFNYFLYHFF